AGAVVEVALAASHTAEIEAQHGKPALHEHVVERIHDLVVHRAPKLGMGMQDERNGAAGRSFVMIARFEAAGGPVDDQLWHACLHPLAVEEGRRSAHGAGGGRSHSSARGANILDSRTRNFHIWFEFRTVRKSLGPLGPACASRTVRKARVS